MPTLDLLQLDLTDECPLFCSHCSNSSGPRFTSALRYDAVKDRVVEAAVLGCRRIVFSGGEPLRYPYFAQLLSLCQALGIRTTVFTTGIRDKRTRLPISDLEWREMENLGLSVAVFSAYAGPSDREFHNRIVRLRPVGDLDAFEVNELGIMRAQQAGIAVELQFIPSDETCSELSTISSWATRLQVCSLHLQYPTLQGRNRESASLVVSHDGEALLKRDALALLQALTSRFHISRLWRARWGIPDEASHNSQLIIRSDGVAALCNACKYKTRSSLTRSIYEQSLRQIWADEIWRNSCCECYTDAASPLRHTATPSRCSNVHIVRTHELLASSAE